MAGVMMTGDEGTEVQTQSVPSIGGDAQVVATAHLNEGGTPPTYSENPQTSLDGGAYPTGTDNGEANNPLKP